MWNVVVPLKELDRAKSRLRRGGLDAKAYARAFALDTVAAVRACAGIGELLVVTDDTELRRVLRPLGCHFCAQGSLPGLNAAVRLGRDRLRQLSDDGPCAVLVGDLPALRPGELDDALRAAAETGGQAFVADTAGSGTTLLAAANPVLLNPAFGRDSAALHEKAGAVRLAGEYPSLRLDVDTAAGLESAAAYGLGVHTTRLWRRRPVPR
ncbi:2-phospho-L-lactate guanylyltransferase [Prauserella flavalba]|uniref:2-phospho-L-lactate guanylyltransferase n=1 Tax=Prauserella flavalba TaxID=1477506 RepID=A0A318LAU9_9PSEU|nr:2-phospho-L-lactate guanylyltransferase [Prauserella flavalba]PXY18752.1 2-phospho-L-lactate guanylyltransferase [Prauserella flavalba]